jgi:ATP-binding cassette subfamily B protein
LGSGESLGVVGPSGAGKSTLIELLARLRLPTTGAIRVQGLEYQSISAAEWTRAVAFVPQEPKLLVGTVRENVCFHRWVASDDDVWAALTLARLADDIVRLPEGLDTHLGERANRLSGGQKQRLSIARALLTRPQLLILDEPTSALDTASERSITDTLRDLRNATTQIVIAHRLSTISGCDRLLLLKDGVQAGFGPPSELKHHPLFVPHPSTTEGTLST